MKLTMESLAAVCECGATHDPAERFYVTVADPGRGVARLAGPLESHAAAIALVPRVKELADTVDSFAVFYSFGTTGVTSPLPATLTPGRFNQELGL